jgi:oligosaccharide repeat unit polymerase
MIAVIVVFYIILLSASYVKCRNWINPIAVIVTWWMFWLIVANVNFVGLYEPSTYTQFLYLLMLGSAVAGGLLAHPMEVKGVVKENKRLIRKWRWGVMLLIPTALLVIALFYKAYALYLTDITLVSRDDMFGDGGLLFPNTQAQLVYTAMVKPLLLAGLIAGLALFVTRQKKWPLVVMTALYTMEAIMMLGRRNIYLFLFLLGLTLFVMVQGNASRSVRAARRYGVIVVVSLVVALLLVTSWRVGDTFDIQRVVERYVVQYHTGGFTIFDQERQDPNSMLNKRIGYGRASLGTIERATAILIFRRIDSTARSLNNDFGSELSEFRKIGPGDGPPGIYMNAYNTILYSLYIDGREVAVILLSMIFGYFLVGHYLAWKRQQRIHSLMICVLLAGIGFIGLFNSPLSGPDLWGTLIVIGVLNRLRLPIPVLKQANRKTSST